MTAFTVPFNNRDISYTAVGGETSFDTDYPVFDEADIQVIRTRSATTTTLTITTDYTVSIAVATGIATVTPVGSVLAADTWRIKGNIIAERSSDLPARPTSDTMADLNEEYDRIWIALQEFVRDLAAAQVAPQTLPLSLLNGGTGASYASAAALRTGLGLIGLAEARGYIAGLTLSNNATDATNDIDIAVGAANASDQSAVLVLGSALTKRLDAVWAVGTNQGMLASGSAITDTTYHIFLIRRPDTGVVDIAADTSATGANIAANTNAAYTQKRRIGSILRESSALVVFRQYGNVFKRAPKIDRNDTAAVASALLAVSVPLGIVVAVPFRYSLGVGASVTCSIRAGDAGAGSADTVIVVALTGAGDSSDQFDTVIAPMFHTNTSAQIYFSQTNTAGTPSGSTLQTIGWVDRRGQDD